MIHPIDPTIARAPMAKSTINIDIWFVCKFTFSRKYRQLSIEFFISFFFKKIKNIYLFISS